MKAINRDQKLLRKTRRKIVTMTTAIVSLLFIALDASFSAYSIIKEQNTINMVLDNTLANIPMEKNESGEEKPNPDFNKPGIDNFRVFAFKLNDDNSIEYIKGENVFSSFINDYLDKIILIKDGSIENVYFRYKEINNDTYFAGFDQNLEITALKQNIFYMSSGLFGGIILVFFISFMLTKLILKPIQDAQQKQKEFISDASHELKTPITIINANASILKNGNENNKWVNNILDETRNMSDLITDMLSLASVEEKTTTLEQIEISSIINSIALSFDAVCYENNIEYESKIEEGLSIIGNIKDVEKITKILIDNAIKYVNEKGIIQIALIKDKNHPTLSIYNSGCNIKDSDKNMIFNRFYRDSVSRDSNISQGSGLGLAILKELCEKYKYSIELDSKEAVFFKITIRF